MVVAISDFNSGAMENKGLNIFNTKYILAKPETATDDDYIHIMSVVAHEYFHNWSGNRVTCRDWFQLSLKEGLTIFRDQSFSEDLLSHAVMRIRDVHDLREAQFPEDAGPLAHPVRPTSYLEISNFYTATIYNKGAEVLRMLQTIVGKAQFRKGMDLYFAQHDGQAVTIDDLLRNIEDVSGVDLTQFKLWYTQAGTPVVTVEDDYDAKKKIYTLKITQVTPATPNQPDKLPMHIPIRLGLLDSKANPVLLNAGEKKSSNETETVVHLTEAAQQFQFINVPSRPLPSLLRHFSAPVKLNYDYTDEQLLFLSRHDSDAFNRWEAGQKYAVRVMLALSRQNHQGQSLQIPDKWLQMIGEVIRDDMQDKFFQSELLTLPTEKYIGEQVEIVHVDSIHAAREFALSSIAKEFESALLDVYKHYQSSNNKSTFTMDAVGARRLKNICLSYLMRLPDQYALGVQQFSASLKTNMTDTLAALSALSNIDVPERQQALDEFYQTWRSDPLVVDKWFAIQAATKLPNALQSVKKLMQHEAFDFKNPNKVYSLIGTFAQRNLVNFHAKNGEAYCFLADVVGELDKINPHVSARMVKPLTSWKRYDKERQKLMCQQLEKLLLSKKISTDLYEVVTKSLEG